MGVSGSPWDGISESLPLTACVCLSWLAPVTEEGEGAKARCWPTDHALEERSVLAGRADVRGPAR